MRKAIGLAVFFAIVSVVFWKVKGSRSAQVLSQAVKSLEVMELTDDQKDRIRPYMEQAHVEAFEQTLRQATSTWTRFDAHAYFDDLIEGTIKRLEDNGQAELAQTLREQVSRLTFVVVED